MVFVIAVDGPAGSGKSSVSKAAARALAFDYLDTGAAYRALAWYALDRGIDLDDPQQVTGLLDGFDYRVGTDPDHFFAAVGDTDVTQDIRTERVSGVVSSVARVPAVREYLNDMFRRIMRETGSGIIAEGRDITTVVAPDAPVRILLTADEEVRMARRSAEVAPESAAEHARHVQARDAADSKVVDFMTAADGVTTVDSTHLGFEETVNAVLSVIERVRTSEGTD